MLSPVEIRIRSRLRSDFEYYAPRCLKIRTKSGAIEPLRLNSAQRYLHKRLGEQKQQTGRVRALILKGRQQGCSTYTEGRYFHRVTYRPGTRAFILTHMDDATNNLFGMAKRFYEHCPEVVRPSLAASNAKELVFDRLDSGYKVGTAGSKGTGRSDTIQLFHGSEVAYWPNADTHVAGALQAVPDEPGTEVILESTSAGRKGLFFEMCAAAMRGEGEYILIFIPWFWQPEYRKPVPPDFVATSDELAYQAPYKLDLEQIVWRRAKIVELNGVHNFRREYPATAAEAFSAEVPGALWKREQIDNLRIHRDKLPVLTRIVIAVDPSGGDKDRNDEVGLIAAGMDAQKHGYVLEDRSGRYTPEGWAREAIALYRKWQADRIVAEANFGGAMVESTIRVVDRSAPVKLVHASRGKQARAEPVAALYESGRMHHVGTFIGLEDEMVTWVPLISKDSPNRVDGLVWAATELLVDGPGTAAVSALRL
jgi:Terminase RNaseH-like domain